MVSVYDVNTRVDQQQLQIQDLATQYGDLNNRMAGINLGGLKQDIIDTCKRCQERIKQLDETVVELDKSVETAKQYRPDKFVSLADKHGTRHLLGTRQAELPAMGSQDTCILWWAQARIQGGIAMGRAARRGE